MLGSYGLLGIFVYCEHKAGSLPPPLPPPTPPRFNFLGPCASFLWIMWKSVVTYIQNQEARENQEEEVVCRQVDPRERPPSSRELPLTLSQTQVTKQGWSLFPEASAASDLSTILFLFYFVHGFDKYQCCFCISFVFKGGGPSFSCNRRPPFYVFYPTQTFL